MHRVSHLVHSAVANIHHVRTTLFVTGAVAATLVGVAASSTPVQAKGQHLQFHRGYAVEGSWLCYGWPSGAYHCTQHWHRANNTLVSDHPSWVPNVGQASTATAQGSYATAKHTTGTHATTRSTTVHTSAPANTNYGASNPGQQAVINEIRAVFGPYAGQALNIARCESGFNPNAYNHTSIGGAHAAGVFQILDSSTWRSTSYAGQSPYNAYANIHAAYEIFQRDGYSWREWQCRA